MKVVLSAFGGKLKSEPMDWPDRTGPNIRLTLDMDGPRLFVDQKGAELVNEPARAVVGVFSWTGEWFIRGGADAVSARVYVLVDVERR